jgi:serine phosphatase RsbU (regulator of sigma subunit)
MNRSRTSIILLALPFAMMTAIFIARLIVGPGWGLLPLLAMGPAIAAPLAGMAYTVAAGAVALAACVPFLLGSQSAITYHPAQIALVAVIGITAASILATRRRRRTDQAVADIRLVADVAQRVLLRPIPRQAGPVQVAVRYLSAASGAQVGGDLYEVVTTPDHMRLIVGDVEGKGLPGVASAAAVLGVFREAAYDEGSLAAIVARIETSLARQLGDEQFVTAVLAEISTDGDKIEVLSCGHPAPLLLGADQPHFAEPPGASLPLGLADLADVPRLPVTIPFEPGSGILFYTDGASEARNKAGEFFPLASSASLRSPADPATRVDQLGDEITRYVGHEPDDDVALLLAYREAA